jgi:hypothetical protein
MDNYKTDVAFRVDKTKDFKGTVFALFPHDVCDNEGHVTTYQHIGQHSSADYRYCISTSKKATAEQYADLKKELEGIGYNLNIRSKQHYDTYLEAHRNLVKF